MTLPIWQQRFPKEPDFTVIHWSTSKLDVATLKRGLTWPSNNNINCYYDYYLQLRDILSKLPNNEIFNELNILEKIHKRNWNQHKRTIHYRSIIQVIHH
jgi:hypothetical protein